jgi:hypothetical protein
MGKRKCPLCFVRVPWTAVLVDSEEIRCPGCHALLELSRFTRICSGLGGALGAWAAVRLTHGVFYGASWVTCVAAAILAFGVASAAFVLIAGDLVLRPKVITSAFPQEKK